MALLAFDIAGELAEPGSRLGPDPGVAVVRELGSWSIRLLLATLSVSTLRRLLRQPRLIRYRRQIGLFAFAYVCVHLLAYLGFLAGFEWSAIEADLLERTYITVGFAGFIGLIPLAVTSTNGWRRRLGTRWQTLHRIIYGIALLGLLHYLWLVKDGYGEAVLYGSWLALLMAERAWYRHQRHTA
jgi:sulfoxide reductase heme-binding subunit YedZ